MKPKKAKLNPAKRLDGKKKLVPLTARMEDDLRQYCREHNIESENELIRQAIVKYLDSEYDDNTLKFAGLKDVQEKTSQLIQMFSVTFSYLLMMHESILAYHPEIADELKDAAFKSASLRQEKFFASFRERIKNDPPFFEKLLHVFVTGSLDA